MAPVAAYHTNCQDGTAAAAVFLRKFPSAITIPLAHGTTAEEIEAALDAVKAKHSTPLIALLGFARPLNGTCP